MAAEDSNPTRRSWNLDRTVGVTVLMTTFMQVVGAVWWASGINAQIKNVQDKVEYLESRTVTQNTMTTDIAVMKAQMEALRDDMKEVKIAVTNKGAHP
jgi:Tfp pilus assembly protein PilO